MLENELKHFKMKNHKKLCKTKIYNFDINGKYKITINFLSNPSYN